MCVCNINVMAIININSNVCNNENINNMCNVCVMILMICV